MLRAMAVGLSSRLERLVLTEARCRVVQVGENAVFASEDSFVAGHGSDVVDVAVNGGDSLEVVDLRDAFLTTDALRQALSVAQCRRVLVRFE